MVHKKVHIGGSLIFMKESKNVGVFQLKNGYWGFRYVISVNGQRKEGKRTKDEQGMPYKTEKQATRAREKMIIREKSEIQCSSSTSDTICKTVKQIYAEYSQKGRANRAYSTIVKQDSLWKNHIGERFGNRYIDEITLAEIQDYLSEVYYTDGLSFAYVESFLKMFYLLYGQAYSRGYITYEFYNKMCVNKITKIHMPKMKIDEETDVIVFNSEQRKQLDQYFQGTNAETAYILGKCGGVRINECYGLKWDNVDFEEGSILIDRQMQYQNGLIKLVPVKTRNAKRKIYLSKAAISYLKKVKERHEKAEQENYEQRCQNQIMIQDIDSTKISSLQLVNSLYNGKIQTVNSMKYHSVKIKKELGIYFKYHYLRHTYGTLLAVMNTPVHVLCNQLGHASVNVTQKYYLGKSELGTEILRGNLEQM